MEFDPCDGQLGLEESRCRASDLDLSKLIADGEDGSFVMVLVLVSHDGLCADDRKILWRSKNYPRPHMASLGLALNFITNLLLYAG
jgi:hypothetical protein